MRTSPARVTVGLCVRDDPAGLRRSMPSVLGQTAAPRVRLVVVDDASADETARIAEAFGADDDTVEVLHNPTPRGLAASRNQVLDRAADGLVAWIGTGDVWHPRRLEWQLAALEEATPDASTLCVCTWRTIGPDPGREHVNVPELGGDQLRAVLTGELAPPAATLLGWAPALRGVGGYDERMGPLLDRDLLTRLLVGGARLLATRPTIPLCTRPEFDRPDHATDPGPTVAAQLGFLDRHAATYRGYGRRFAREQRRAVLLDAADRLEQAGHGPRAAALRTRAGALDAVGWVARRPALGRLVRRARTVDARVRGRTTGPAVDGARRPPTKDPAGQPTGLTAWLRDAERRREADDLRGAQEALERGLDAHPGDAALLARLTEVLLLRRDWSGCARAWDALDGTADPAVTDFTCSVAASAHRMLGDHARALEVAEAGSRRWPRSHHVQRELYRARSALVDWRSCVHPSPTSPATGTVEEPVGVVTDLGFLLGGSGGLAGRLDDAGLAADRAAVSLLVGDEPVATTHARRDPRDPAAPATFTIDAHDLLEYLGDGDVLSVRSAGQPLHLQGFGPRCVVITGYPSRVAVLRKRLRTGWVFAKFGRLRRRPSREDKRDILAFLQELSAPVRRLTGQTVVPLYGNLLGAVREHDFIVHDVGGFDAGYVSGRQAPEEVRAEFVSVCRSLLDLGYHLTVNPWGAMVRRRSTDPGFLDLNFGWFTPDGQLQLSYGWRHAPATDPARLRRPRQCPLAGHLVPVPGNAEDVLAQIYGPGWVVPDQGFDLDLDLQRDPRFLLTDTELEALRERRPDRVVIESVLGPGGEATSPVAT